MSDTEIVNEILRPTKHMPNDNRGMYGKVNATQYYYSSGDGAPMMCQITPRSREELIMMIKRSQA